jgi:type IV pilus modification protein PilV
MNTLIKREHQRGASLIEVLVALMILVISLLGVAAVQLRLEQFTQSAVARSQSSNALTDIIEKMRANKLSVLSGAYDVEFSGTSVPCNAPDLIVRYADKAGLKDATTPAVLAQQEVVQMQREIACTLPAGAVRIVSGQTTAASNLTCTPPLTPLTDPARVVVTIIVRYDDRKADLKEVQAAQATGTQTPQLRCFTEVVEL